MFNISQNLKILKTKNRKTKKPKTKKSKNLFFFFEKSWVFPFLDRTRASKM